MYLIIAILSIALTIAYQFPNGIKLEAPIIFYSYTRDDGNTQKIFDNGNHFVTIRF